MQNSPSQKDKLIFYIICGGWLCLLLSSTCFYISTRSVGISTGSSMYLYAIWLTFARIFGIGGFIVGVVAIVNQRWLNGALLFIGSVALPFLSLFIHGSL